jgi:putative aldouronate transport system permease protein
MLIKERNGFFSIVFFTMISLLCIVPLLYIIGISLSNDLDIAKYGYSLIPKKVDFYAYGYIFKTPQMIVNSFIVSMVVTTLGTVFSILMTCAIAYPMTRKDYRYSKIFTFLMVIPILIQGGLVPWYIMITQYLHLQDTIWVLFLPYSVTPWFVLLMKGFMSTISFEIVESAKIDGASEFATFFKIIMPLSKPAIATISLFYAFTFWNDWWLPMLYINNDKLVPLQYMLYKIMSNIQGLARQMSTGQNIDISQIPTESARMAMCVLASGPMLIVFPFFQKYFVKGLAVGSIKG